MPEFYSPNGNLEVWDMCPAGYATVEDWNTAHPAIQPFPRPFTEVLTAKQMEISSAFNAAMAASLTMPSVGTPPSSFEVASALYDWRSEDPEGYASLLAIHTARRDELLAAVAAADTAAAVQAIAVSYAV